MAKLQIAGVLEGVDFTKAGSFVDDSGKPIKYGTSVNLTLSTLVDIVKEGIPTKTKRSFRLKVPVEDIDLENRVKIYNSMIGKTIVAEFVPTDGQRFTVVGEITAK